MLSTLSIAPLPASNNVSDLGHMLGYLHSHGFASVQLVNGTEAFHPSIVGVVPAVASPRRFPKEKVAPRANRLACGPGRLNAWPNAPI